MRLPDIRGDILIEECAVDIFKITLPQPFYAPNHVYFVKDDEPLLIDSGYVESLGKLTLSLRKIGVRLSSIRTVLYTHPHLDHITGGLMFSQYARNTQRAGHYRMAHDIPDYVKFLEDWQLDTARLMRIAFRDHKTRQQRIRRANEPWKKLAYRFANPNYKQGDRKVALDRLLREGDVIATGQYSFQIFETPGHCKWHITPVEVNTKLIFTGDLLIGNIPAIYDAIDGKLEDYYLTLEKLTAFNDHRFFPAHGSEISNPARQIKLVKKTLGILEKGVLRHLGQGERNLRDLLELAMGGQIEGGTYFITALSLIESIIRKLHREKQVVVTTFDDGYELYSLP